MLLAIRSHQEDTMDRANRPVDPETLLASGRVLASGRQS